MTNIHALNQRAIYLPPQYNMIHKKTQQEILRLKDIWYNICLRFKTTVFFSRQQIVLCSKLIELNIRLTPTLLNTTVAALCSNTMSYRGAEKTHYGEYIRLRTNPDGLAGAGIL